MTAQATTAPFATDATAAAAPPRSVRRANAARRRTVQVGLATAGTAAVCAGFLLPFVWMLSTSFKTVEQTMASPPQLMPRPLAVENFSNVWRSDRVDFPLCTRNTLVVAALVGLGTTLSSAVVAYGFAKVRFAGRGVLFAVMLGTMMIPYPVMMVPLFVVFRFVGDHSPFQMLGTFKPLWIPAWLGNAFSIFLLRQFYLTIPDALGEAAKIDGCSEFGIFWRIFLPLSRPALTVVALFAFMGAWKDYLGPLIYLQRPSQYTLALGLAAMQSQQGGTQQNQLMAAALLVMLPVLVLFFLAQKNVHPGHRHHGDEVTADTPHKTARAKSGSRRLLYPEDPGRPPENPALRRTSEPACR